MSKNKEKKRYNLFRIDWIDAASNSKWQDLDDISFSHYKVNSIGWLIKETKDYYFIAQNLSCQYQCSDIMQIPTKWIVKKTKIRGNQIIYDNDER